MRSWGRFSGDEVAESDIDAVLLDLALLGRRSLDVKRQGSLK